MTLPSQSAGRTEGPWYFDDGNGGEYFPHVVIGGDDPKSKNYITINTARGKNGGTSMAEHQANARLIARAPDLLAENSKLKGQLEEAVAALAPFAAEYVADDAACHVGICTKEKCGRCSRILAARAAIKRAKLKEAGS